jgi:hypothetical protein
MIPGADANASSTIGTVQMAAYKITNKIFLIDYPHFDSTDFSHKLQFIFTRRIKFIRTLIVIFYTYTKFDVNIISI